MTMGENSVFPPNGKAASRKPKESADNLTRIVA
jgi:hypothetical protein